MQSETALPVKKKVTEDITPHHQSFWLFVMCLTGVDYFSTLGYQPSIAFQNAGVLAPIATLVLVAVTLFGALPIYRYVAGRSFIGQGSIGMFVDLFSGWSGKMMVLVLLGFACTGFVLTKTLSAADAALHLLENPNWPWPVHEDSGTPLQLISITMIMLVLLGAMFLRGFKEVIGLAVVIVVVYMTLNALIIGSGIIYLFGHADYWHLWIERLQTGQWFLPNSPIGGGSASLLAMIAASMLLFPKLALGLSGFETGVAVIPNIRGAENDEPAYPAAKIANAKKLLFTAAAIMSVYLIGSSIVVSTLIDPADLTPVSASGELPKNAQGKVLRDPENWPKKPGAGRALAFLAHGESDLARSINPLFGATFGTIYDISTIVILWFAGASAMVGLLNLVPQYLPKYGMAPEWAKAIKPMVILFTAINLFVTWVFEASVDAQGGAYATGVLALMTSACIAAVIDIYRRREGNWYHRLSWPFAMITLVFIYTTIVNEIEKNFRGLAIAMVFIVTIVSLSFISRILRSRELRYRGFRMADPESMLLWDTIKDLEMTVLVPHRPGRRSLPEKEMAIRKEHRLPRELMVVFVEIVKADASDFAPEPVIKIKQEQGRYIIHISEAASVSHTLAAMALEMAKVGKPPEIHFGWTDESPLSGTIGFLLFGEGNIPWMVRELVRRAEPDPDKRPVIIVAGV